MLEVYETARVKLEDRVLKGEIAAMKSELGLKTDDIYSPKGATYIPLALCTLATTF